MGNLTIHLRMERENEPLCVETAAPEFTWYLQSPQQGCRQETYRLRVETADGELLWDTGERRTEETGSIYAGAPLLPETTCLAHLTVTDTTGSAAETTARFRTGLMDDRFDGEAWGGAKWIGTDAMPLWAQALSVFELSCEVTLEEDSRMAGIIFGANDFRLMDRYKNIQGLEAYRFQSYICVRLNTAPMDAGETARLEVFRVGYTPEDSRETPLASMDIPALSDRFAPHTILVRALYGQLDFYLDGVQLNEPQGEDNPWNNGRINLNPMGRGGDYTCFPALCDIGVKLEPGQNAAFRNLTVRNYRKPKNILARELEEGSVFRGGRNGTFWILDPSRHGIPMVRREFLAGNVKRAYLTITARGVYEAYLNGKKVGDDFLAPGLTQYNSTHMYQVYDVTELLRHGENALGIWLGEGWWSGSISFSGENWNFFGDRQSVIAKLTVEKPDGGVQTIVTDPETFQCSDEGPIRYASLFQGQVYDAVYEEKILGWTEPGFDGDWGMAEEIPLSPANTAMGEFPGVMGKPQIMDYAGLRCIGQIGNGVKCVKTLPAQSAEEVRPGVFVYDFGQNIAGIPEVRLPGSLLGQEVILRYAEMCYPKSPEYGDQAGMLMTENLRAALATDVVYLGEQEILFRPQFTFHGFRYLEISGVDGMVPMEDVRALALSSVTELCADYRCSDERVNRLFENICWSLRDNFLSIPTDCPQRNERMGWSGDLSVFARTAVYLGDADAFLRRHMMAIRDLQKDSGEFPNIAPVTDGFGGILWGSVGMTAAWEAYEQYGDTTLLAEHYGAMARYIDFLNNNVDEETGLQTAGELGDWLGPQNGKTENALLWMAYYVYDLKLMAKTAEVLLLPEAECYETLWEMTRQRFNEVYFDPETHRTVYSSEDAARGNRMPFAPVDQTKPLPPKEPGGGYRMDTQTSYCVPLALGVVEQEHEDQALRNLASICQSETADDEGNLRPPYSLMTGFIGTAWILPALSMGDRDDIAYRMLLNRSYPSWLYPVDQGATTIWERLDSYTADRGFGGHNSMNSFNHYSFGAVGQWLISRSLGISRDDPGFRNFILQPMPDEDREMTEAGGWCMTPAGKIESRWKAVPRGWEYVFVIPANTHCTLRLPGSFVAKVQVNGDAPADAPGVTVLGHNGQFHQFWLEPGSYRFTVIR